MNIKPPTLDDLDLLAQQYGLELSIDDLESFQGLMAGPIASYERIDQLTEPKPAVKYARAGGYRPEPGDNPLNAWYQKCSIKGARGGKLKGKTKVAGAIQRRVVMRVDPHQHRHHASDRAGDMIAIAQHVILTAGPPIAGIKREALDQVMGVAVRNTAFPHDQAKAVKSRIAGGFAPQRPVGHHPHIRKACLRVGHDAHCPAMVLAVGDIVASAAPSVEQPGAFAGLPVEQLGCHGEAFGAARDAVAGMGDEPRAIRGSGIGHSPHPCPRAPPASRGYSRAAFIAKIVSCG